MPEEQRQSTISRLNTRVGPKPSARITIVEYVTHQSPGDRPATVITRNACNLINEGQHYNRLISVGEQWIPLSSGWINNPSLILLKNEGKTFTVNPTIKEREEEANRFIEIGIQVYSTNNNKSTLNPLTPTPPIPSPPQPTYQALLYLPPRESIRLRPLGRDLFFIRCTLGEAKVTVNAYPQ